MERYIDAVDCAKIISKECNIPLGDLVDVFAKVPTADVVEVKHARWKGAGMGDYECTGCWEVYSGGNRFKRCPNCGAIMDAMSLSKVLTGSGRSDT